MEVFDVGRTLLSFADIREQALSLQFKALSTYESTINSIDNRVTEGLTKSQQAEHNLLRHLGSSAVNSTSSSAEEIIESAGEKRTIDSAAELEASCCDDEKLGSDLSYPVIPPEILQLINASTLVKPEVLTYEQKFENRKSLFEFLAVKENYEMELERHIEEMRAMENPDRLKIENASNLLYDTQIYNAETVRKAVIGYKPAHTAKAWTSDPDYKVLLSLFEGAVIRKRSTRKKKKAGLNMKKKKQKLAVIKRNDNDESQL